MATDLFDRSVRPRWRDVGGFTLSGPATVAAADPCYGELKPVRNAQLEPGEWLWQVRDADENGASSERVWEVRLRRADAQCEEDWAWVDEYGRWVDEPAAGARDAGVRGVDSGTMAWHVEVPGDAALDLEGLLFGYEHVWCRGRTLVTSTGWGDGGYGIAVRRVDGRVVEVRMAFITPEPEPLTADRFRELLPGALLREDVVDVRLEVERHTYTAAEMGDHANLRTESYDTVLAVTLPEDGVTYHAGDKLEAATGELVCDPEVVRAVGALWSRTPEPARAELTAAATEGERRPGTAQGWIVERYTVPAIIDLAVA